MGLAGKRKRERSTSAAHPSEKHGLLDQTVEGISVLESLALCAHVSSALGTAGLLGAMLSDVLALDTVYWLREQVA